MDPRVFQLATNALHDAQRGRMGRAANSIREIHDKHGVDELGQAVLAWVDTLVARLPPLPDGPAPQVVWQIAETGQRTGAEGVEPSARWAGQIINARMADDKDTYVALMRAVPEGSEMGRHVLTLLYLISYNLNCLNLGTHPNSSRGAR